MRACLTARVTATKLLYTMGENDTVEVTRPLINQVIAMIPPEERHHSWWIVPVPRVE